MEPCKEKARKTRSDQGNGTIRSSTARRSRNGQEQEVLCTDSIPTHAKPPPKHVNQQTRENRKDFHLNVAVTLATRQ